MKTKQIVDIHDLEKAFHIREKVFVAEQGVPLEDEFDEYDHLDGDCDHILAFYDGMAVGTGRIRVVEGIGKLERICVLEPFRAFGLGKLIIQALEEVAAGKKLAKVKLHGQTQAEGFYHKLGYETASDEFMEDGIPHVVMTKEL
ncbi:GNAT family N-acetyltransferase [Alkalihalophilus marmarensis]|uniref:N-acetyltransferase domain-containing protein n=1 Tax=Alkalihalophilus marmarensis DSM 21297 TaxID=1188261 RepID=U6SSZ7_9BACI|nr:GNAT family N-acetyltransferase [Alkalihalophilus marmarensis]ERN54030.1 hypothetical protein A33I_08650 [Alkalihalophilus marmarensis DSM 21297]MCM3488150.1 GNAT family N-acetyltransferase [Alkalihalophilus marmarensis]